MSTGTRKGRTAGDKKAKKELPRIPGGSKTKALGKGNVEARVIDTIAEEDAGSKVDEWVGLSKENESEMVEGMVSHSSERSEVTEEEKMRDVRADSSESESDSESEVDEGIREEEEEVPFGIPGVDPASEMAQMMMLINHSNQLQLRALRKAEIERERRADKRRERREKKVMKVEEEKRKAEEDKQAKMIEAQARTTALLYGEQRREGDLLRTRERARSEVKDFKEREDLGEFLAAVETKWLAAGIPKEDWGAFLGAKFSGTLGDEWAELAASDHTYAQIKDQILRQRGYTPEIAGERLFAFRSEDCKELTAGQLWSKGAKLCKRMMAECTTAEQARAQLLRAWYLAVLPKRARVAVRNRNPQTDNDYVLAVQDFLMEEGDRGDGLTATFRKGEGGRDRSGPPQGVCHNCGKKGHRAVDCWSGKGREGKPMSKPPRREYGSTYNSYPSDSNRVVCFSCNQTGHKSPYCPLKNVKKEKDLGKPETSNSFSGTSARPARRVSVEGSTEESGSDESSSEKEAEVGNSTVTGEVNGQSVSIVLDSGADISIVPAKLVDSRDYTGEYVAVRPFAAEKRTQLAVARVVFHIQGEEWVERVAVQPADSGAVEEILYCLDLASSRGAKLIGMVKRKVEASIMRVETRAETRRQEKVEAAEETVIEVEQPSVTPVIPTRRRVRKRKFALSAPEPPVVDAVESVEAEVVASSDDDPEVVDYEVRTLSEGRKEWEVPPVKEGDSGRAQLVKETSSDPTLRAWRALADTGQGEFRWDLGVLLKAVVTHMGESEEVVVLPEAYREKVLKLAHDNLGHGGVRKVTLLLRRSFVWPSLGSDVAKYCKTCEQCQRCAKGKARKAPLVEREVFSEPFEVVAMDIVGPMPKGKGGCRFVLTMLDMASKWPEAIPLRTVTARVVATAMIEVFGRTGLPLQLLTDQGAQFTGSLMRHLCRDLGIDKLQTSAYHPECNGAIERMHGTLGPMLTKAASKGLDWVGQLPFALFALRSAPNRDSLFSPYELVYGRRARTPLDLLRQGWAEVEFEDLEVEEWSEWLRSRMESWHEVARERWKRASSNRKEVADRKSVVRTLEVGDQVLCRVPGMIPKLTEAWHGPYTILEQLNQVNFRIEVKKGRKRVVHLNNIKKFNLRQGDVRRVVVVAEDVEEDGGKEVNLGEVNPEFDQSTIEMLREKYPSVLSDEPGKTEVCRLTIRTGDASPIASYPYRVPDRLKDKVRVEIGKLVEKGIVVPSVSPWASPIVPVPKKDGTLRICIDYRKLNAVTTNDPYYMATLDEILERVGESRFISTVDLSKGFYQIKVDQDSIDKTAFVTPFGKYAFTRMPFGLRNAPAVFQRCVEVVLSGCYAFAAPYIDDIIIFSRDKEAHTEHLGCVFEALSRNGLTIKEGKCVWGRKQVAYLGHLVGYGQLAVPAHRASAMEYYIQPKTKKQLRSFLGTASYYRRFVPNFASFSSQLSPSTTKLSPGVVDWTPRMLEAFHHLKVCLTNTCVLTIPSQEDVFVLHTDASGAGIGATLNVTRDDVSRPTGYYSRQLQGAERRYSATELEALAIYKAVQFFAPFLWGCHFTVVTDHQALTSLMTSVTLNRRLRGWALKLQDFDFKVVYRAGRLNGDADGLSRQGWCDLDETTAGLQQGSPRTDSKRAGGDVGPAHIQAPK